METKYYKVINCSGNELDCGVVFDERVDFAKRIELIELLKMNDYKLVEVTEEEYQKIPRKLDAI